MHTTLLVLFLPILAFATPKFDFPEFFTQVEQTWEKTASYKAHFNQKIFSKTLGVLTPDESEGTLMVLKPGRLRWICDTDKSVQILNGKRFQYVQEDERRKKVQLDIWEDVSGVIQAKPLQFLAGKVKLKEAYRGQLKELKKDSVVIQLIDRQKQSDSYLAEFDRKSYLLLSLSLEDPATRMVVTFSNIQPHAKLEPELFEYRPDPSKTVVVKH